MYLRVLYTKHLTRKHKSYQDGFVCSISNTATLYSAEGATLGVCKLKPSESFDASTEGEKIVKYTEFFQPAKNFHNQDQLLPRCDFDDIITDLKSFVRIQGFHNLTDTWLTAMRSAPRVIYQEGVEE